MPTGLNWLKWRLVVESVATLKEIETHWDLCDLLDGHMALDLKMEAQARSYKSPKK